MPTPSGETVLGNREPTHLEGHHTDYLPKAKKQGAVTGLWARNELGPQGQWGPSSSHSAASSSHGKAQVESTARAAPAPPSNPHPGSALSPSQLTVLDILHGHFLLSSQFPGSPTTSSLMQRLTQRRRAESPSAMSRWRHAVHRERILRHLPTGVPPCQGPRAEEHQGISTLQLDSPGLACGGFRKAILESSLLSTQTSNSPPGPSFCF